MSTAKYLVVVLLLFCLRDCSANNSDPCLNPSNQNLIVPFRLVVNTNSYFNTPNGDTVNIYDSTHCYLLQVYSIYVSQFESSVYSSSSYAYFSGTLRNICNNGQQLDLTAYESTNNALISFPSNTLSPINLSPLYLQGNLYNGSLYSWTANITLDAATFWSNVTNPSTVYQYDDFTTFDNSPCTIRTRTDQIDRSNIYSPTIPLKIRLYNGTLLQFNYPINTRSRVSRSVSQKYYQQCTCAESNLYSQSTASNNATTTSFTIPNIPGVRTASTC